MRRGGYNAMPLQIRVELSDELLALLDQRVAKSGRSRSEIIRSAIERELSMEIESAIDKAIVDGYTRLPQGPDPWAEASGKRSIEDEPW